ncbi:hypothetical protein L873DRAFT_1820974, partial [Choiromyces venosus 120613-1]
KERKISSTTQSISLHHSTERVYKDLYRLKKRKLLFEQLGRFQIIIAYPTNIPLFDAELLSPISRSVSSRGLTRRHK